MPNSTPKKPPEKNSLLDDGEAGYTRKAEWHTAEDGDKLKLVDHYQMLEKRETERRTKAGEKLEIGDIPGYESWCKRRKLDQRHISRESNAKG